MDDGEKEALIEMLVANSVPIRSLTSVVAGVDNETFEIDRSGDDPLASMKYHYALQRLALQYFDINEYRVTANDLHQSLMAALTDLAKDPAVLQQFVGKEPKDDSDEQGIEQLEPSIPVDKTVGEDGLVEVFSAKVGAIKRDWGKAPPCEFTIWFPWHVDFGGDSPTFDIYDHTFESADESEWLPWLERIARARDVGDGGALLEEIEQGEYDVWKATISARTPEWAMIRFKNSLDVLSAQLNHAAYFLDHRTRPKRLGRSTGDFRDGGRWTAIQRPFGVFFINEYAEDESHYPNWGANVYRRGGRPRVPLDFSAIKQRFETHHPFGDVHIQDEPRLHNALVDYQQGLTETDHKNSFINFWRVIEDLSLAGQGKKEVTVNRALIALKLATDGEYDPFFDRVAGEIWGVRNTRTHDTGWVHIGSEHEIVAKLLADAMIELYVTEFLKSDGTIDETSTRRVFKWADKSQSARNETHDALDTVDRLFGE